MSKQSTGRRAARRQGGPVPVLRQLIVEEAVVQSGAGTNAKGETVAGALLVRIAGRWTSGQADVVHLIVEAGGARQLAQVLIDGADQCPDPTAEVGDDEDAGEPASSDPVDPELSPSA